ncbi:MAG: hypothetical protein J6V84_07560 [Clostridia bacterium]|nr:hypothetical protein [Clostridia bacterium]
MENKREKVTYTTNSSSVLLALLFGILFIVFLALTIFLIYIFVNKLLGGVMPFGPLRIVVVFLNLVVSCVFLAVLLYLGWAFLLTCGLFTTRYTFDIDGIHANGLFKNQFISWSQIKDFGFTFVRYEYEYKRTRTRYSSAEFFQKVGRIYKAYFSDSVCQSLPEAKKKLEGNYIAFYVNFPLTTPQEENYNGITMVREFLDYTEEKTGIKPHIPGYAHPFLYPEKLYNSTERSSHDERQQ